MAYGTLTAGVTVPPQGAFTATTPTAATGQYPTTGRGNISPTAGLAHWTALGLTAGNFEVEIVGIIIAATGTCAITELKASAVTHFFPGGAGAGSGASNGGGGNPGVFMFPHGIRCQDGFAVTFSGAGGTVLYRIHVYRQPSSY